MSFRTTPHLIDVFDTPQKWTRSHWHTMGRNHADAAIARAGKDDAVPNQWIGNYLNALMAGAEVELARHDGSMQMYYWIGYIKSLNRFAELAERDRAA